MKPTLTLDTTKLRKAIRDLRPHVKQTHAELVHDAAKGFVKRVVSITPPSGKKTKGTAARKAGEFRIKSDLARIMVGVTRKAERDKRETTASPEALHKRFRDRRTGRVNPGGLKDPYRVAKSELLALQRKLIKSVGMLASGWNAAAQKLGVKLPAWITRHGIKRGNFEVKAGLTKTKITISNDVAFVGNVLDFDRRIQSAVDLQANAMKRKAEYLLKKGLRKAGWK